jgi:tripartite-type tricarboxylate transporter receptor subunit TctC
MGAGILLAAAVAAAHGEPTARPFGAGAPVVRLYIPFSAGAGAHAAGRNFQNSVSRLSGQVMEMVHLTAESGAAAGRAVHAAPSDGRTLLLARVGSSAIQPSRAPHTALPLSEFTVLALLDQAPRIRALRDPAAYLRQQQQFYERLATLLGAQP